MAIVIEDLQMERLAQQLAKAEGVTVSERAKSMHCRNLQPATIATTPSSVMTSTAVSHRCHRDAVNYMLKMPSF